jgi:hypothetical protein
MIQTPLAACPACARHLRVTEPTCPFCRAALPASFRELTAPAPPATRLSRAALYALRVGALSVTTVACGGAVSTGSQEHNDSGSSDATTIGLAAYGGSPPLDDAGGQDDAQFGVMYGLFMPLDSGGDDAPTGFIGGPVYGGFFAPPYGLPPPPPDASPADASSQQDGTFPCGSVGAAYGGFPFPCGFDFEPEPESGSPPSEGGTGDSGRESG